MPSIGETLREARMRQRLDIADVEAQTKIRAKYLRALENEEFSMLPGPTFVKTFLRTYAELLGLDPHRLVDEYRANYESGEELEQLQPLGPPGSRGRERRQRSGGGPRPGPLLLVVVAAVLAVLIVLGLTADDDGDGDGSRAAETDTVQTQTHAHRAPARAATGADAGGAADRAQRARPTSASTAVRTPTSASRASSPRRRPSAASCCV